MLSGAGGGRSRLYGRVRRVVTLHRIEGLYGLVEVRQVVQRVASDGRPRQMRKRPLEVLSLLRLPRVPEANLRQHYLRGRQSALIPSLPLLKRVHDLKVKSKLLFAILQLSFNIA